MTHSEVIDHLAEHLQLSKTEVRRLLEQTTDVIRRLLDQERIIHVPDLGTFQTKERDKRKGFHPQRKQHMMLPKRRVVSYHPASSLRNHVKNMRIER